MQTEPTFTDDGAIPEGAGLASGRAATLEDAERRGRSELLDAAEAGNGLSPAENDDLVAYYLSNDELPGDTSVTDVEVTLGRKPIERKFKASVHPIEWSEWQDARERATDDKTGQFDAYVSSSWVVARALVTPKLGPTIARLHNAAKASEDGKIDGPDGSRIDPPADAAHLLRRMFRKQSGALLELSAKVLELSKLQNDSNSVREVEAAKN